MVGRGDGDGGGGVGVSADGVGHAGGGGVHLERSKAGFMIVGATAVATNLCTTAAWKLHHRSRGQQVKSPEVNTRVSLRRHSCVRRAGTHREPLLLGNALVAGGLQLLHLGDDSRELVLHLLELGALALEHGRRRGKLRLLGLDHLGHLVVHLHRAAPHAERLGREGDALDNLGHKLGIVVVLEHLRAGTRQGGGRIVGGGGRGKER
eukprot:5120032-Pleurochrysis_carterae.AAC.1